MEEDKWEDVATARKTHIVSTSSAHENLTNGHSQSSTLSAKDLHSSSTYKNKSKRSYKSRIQIQVTPAINLTACKYELKLEVPSAEGMTEMYLRFNSVSKAEW